MMLQIKDAIDSQCNKFLNQKNCVTFEAAIQKIPARVGAALAE